MTQRARTLRFSNDFEALRHKSMQCVIKQGGLTRDLHALTRMT
jgi:hypothetical protein